MAYNRIHPECHFAGKEFVRLLETETLDKLRDLNFVSKRGERAELFHAGRLRAVVEEMNCLDDYFCIRWRKR